MDPRFTDYADAVGRRVRYATKKERAAIRKELTDHMEDHAQALMDGGFDEAHARQVALDHMGDPAEVGLALNREYPKVWFLLSRVMMVLLILISLTSLLYLPFHTISTTLQIRMDPMHYFQPTGPVTPLDIRHELPGGTIHQICGVSLEANTDGTYLATVYTTKYQKNPLLSVWDTQNSLSFTPSEKLYTLQDYNLPVTWWSGGGVSCQLYEIPLPRNAALTAHYDHYGTRFHVEIPLPWEEVAP